MFGSQINPPRVYSEWVDIFEMLKDRTDDEAVLSAMQRGTVEWQSGVAERFSSGLIEAVNYRLNAASDRFQRDMNRSGGQERVIVQSLISLRKEMAFLAKVMNLPAIPEKDRGKYIKLVTDQADEVQKALEDSGKKDRTGKLASLVRNNKVNQF